MNPFLGTLAMLSLFHIIGGIVLGTALRQLLHRRFSCNSWFLIVWGAIFGLTPFVFGATVFGLHSNLLFLGLEIATFVVPILVLVLTPDWFVEAFDTKRIAPVAAGALFMVVGIAVGVLMWPDTPGMALLFLLAFGGAGAFLFVSSIRDALRS